MSRFIGFLAAAALLTACASELEGKAAETFRGYQSSVDAQIAAAK